MYWMQPSNSAETKVQYQSASLWEPSPPPTHTASNRLTLNNWPTWGCPTTCHIYPRVDRHNHCVTMTPHALTLIGVGQLSHLQWDQVQANNPCTF